MPIATSPLKPSPPNLTSRGEATLPSIWTRARTEALVERVSRSEPDHSAIGLGEFFDLVDTDGNNEVSPEEIEAAHEWPEPCVYTLTPT